MKLKEINADILYLLKRCCSFGTPPIPAQNLVRTKNIIFELCGLKLYMYYYPPEVGNTGTLMKTPWGMHELYSNNYEGKNHPYCKIEIPEGYENYTFNDKGIFDGTNVIYDIVNDKLPTNVDDNMLLALIINNHYSLIERLSNYVYLLENEKVIDHGHINAGYFTRKIMEFLFTLIKSFELKTCIHSYLNNTNLNIKFIFNLFKQMEQFRLNREPTLKDYIVTSFNNVSSNLPQPELPIFDIISPLKPSKLF